jgi:hypothetical protein
MAERERLIRAKVPGRWRSALRRADGRWMGRFYAWTTAGTRSRITVYGRTRQEVTGRMREAQERDRQGIPVPDRAWKLADWLDYWLEHVISPNRRRATYALYEMVVRTDLKPALGKYPLTRLSAARVQPSSTASCCWPVDPPGPDYEDGTVVRFDSRYARRAGRAQRRPSGRAAKLGAQPHHSMDSG